MKKSRFLEVKKQAISEAEDVSFEKALERGDLSDFQDEEFINYLKEDFPSYRQQLEDIHQKANQVFEVPEEADSQREIANYFADWLVEHQNFRGFQLGEEEVRVWYFDEDERIWMKDGEQEIRQMARKALDTGFSSYLKNEIIESVKGLDPRDGEDVGPDEKEIPVGNGMLVMN